MKLHIKNLAQIKSATIEDSQLMLLIGDNGVGKTLLLETKTLISNFYADKVEEFAKEVVQELPEIIEISTDWDELLSFINNKATASSDEEFDGLDFKEFKLEVSFKENSEFINRKFRSKIEKNYQEAIKEVNDKITFSKDSDLEFEFLDLPEAKGNLDFNFTIINTDERLLSYTLKSVPEKLNITEGGIIRLTDIFNTDKLITNEKLMKKISHSMTDEEVLKDRIIDNLSIDILILIFKYYFKNHDTLYLPSERNLFVDNALRKAIGEMRKNEGENAGKKFNSRYSEYLFNVSYLEYIDSITRFNRYGIEMIENDVFALEKLFGGKLNFAESGEPESIKKEGKVVIRELFSTKENRLIPYILIFDPFKHYNQIIIEEPEAHLSLRSMNELVEFIATLLKNKSSVLLTTHSDVFFTRINNLLMKNKAIETKVYEMKSYPNGSILEEKKNGEYGYEIDLFSSELNDLINDTIEIQDGESDDN